METLTELPTSLVEVADKFGLVLNLEPKAEHQGVLSRKFTYGPWYVTYKPIKRTVLPGLEAVYDALAVSGRNPVLEVLPEDLCTAEKIPQRKAVTQIRERALAKERAEYPLCSIVLNESNGLLSLEGAYHIVKARMGASLRRTGEPRKRLVGYATWDPVKKALGAMANTYEHILTAQYLPSHSPAVIALFHHVNCDTVIRVTDPAEPVVVNEAWHMYRHWDNALRELSRELPAITPLAIESHLAAYKEAAATYAAAESALADAILSHQSRLWSGPSADQLADAHSSWFNSLFGKDAADASVILNETRRTFSNVNHIFNGWDDPVDLN